jgi:hypothetical protein
MLIFSETKLQLYSAYVLYKINHFAIAETWLFTFT